MELFVLDTFMRLNASYSLYGIDQPREKALCQMAHPDLSARERNYFTLWEQVPSVSTLWLQKFQWLRLEKSIMNVYNINIETRLKYTRLQFGSLKNIFKTYQRNLGKSRGTIRQGLFAWLRNLYWIWGCS